MSKIVEGVWDCTYCDTKKIRGSIRVCPNCGRPRDENIKFYVDEPNNYVVDEEKINKNPDWLCPYCDSLNPDDVDTCIGCGASREKALNYFENRIEKEKKPEPVVTSTKASPYSFLRFLIPVVLILGLMIYMIMPKTKTISIDEKQWHRTVNVEELQAVKESSFSLPSDAYDVTSQEEISGYRQIITGYTTNSREVAEQVLDGYDTYTTLKDLGNGYFEEVENMVPRYRTEYHTETYQVPIYAQEPVYGTKYYYTIDKWIVTDTLDSQGSNDRPYFPEPKLTKNERLGDTTEEYFIISGKNTYKCTLEIYEAVTEGKKTKVKINGNEIISLE